MTGASIGSDAVGHHGDQGLQQGRVRRCRFLKAIDDVFKPPEALPNQVRILCIRADREKLQHHRKIIRQLPRSAFIAGILVALLQARQHIRPFFVVTVIGRRMK